MKLPKHCYLAWEELVDIVSSGCHDVMMRTTLTIDDDVLRAAKTLAAQRGATVGAVISELARRGLEPKRSIRNDREGLPVFDVREGAPVFGPEDVGRALDDR